MKDNTTTQNPTAKHHHKTKCPCCGRFNSKPKAKEKSFEQQTKEYTKRIEAENEARMQQERKQRMIDRAAYAHVIPWDKRYSSLSQADEWKYQCQAAFERMTPEEWEQLKQSLAVEPSEDNAELWCGENI